MIVGVSGKNNIIFEYAVVVEGSEDLGKAVWIGGADFSQIRNCFGAFGEDVCDFELDSCYKTFGVRVTCEKFRFRILCTK